MNILVKKSIFLRSVSLSAVSLAVIATASAGFGQSVEYGDFTTPNGSNISVEEDFMDARYPRHVISLAATDQTDRDGSLIFRCQQNRTEAYFVSGPFDFFGFGSSPVVNVRFASDDQANALSVSLSSNAEAVFFSNPVDFITRTLVDGSVGIMGNYFSGSYRHNFVLDDETKSAIYDMGTTCEWIDGLPARATASDDEVTEQTSFNTLSEALETLIAEYGEDLFREVLSSILDTNTE